MENNAKVFSSDITRVCFIPKNNLYELLTVVPAKPVKLNDIKETTCDFTPRIGKQYIPKVFAKSNVKVRTIADIRRAFEQDVYRELKPDLETQQNILMEKIRQGSSRDDDTKKMAIEFLKSDEPIPWLTWQMLINLNPENHKYPRQFVFWNGKSVELSGSSGGMEKTICNYDLSRKPRFLLPQNSKKNYLKQHEATRHLPNLGLAGEPAWSTGFNPPITNYLNNLCNEDGTISQEWAELAVSVLGTVKDVPLIRDCVTFDLVANTVSTSPRIIENNVQLEVEDMLHKIIDAVEIHLTQDTIFTQEMEVETFPSEDLYSVSTDKSGKLKRKFDELEKLNLTFTETEDRTKTCSKMYCALGCICASLKGTCNFNQHCGRVECMFKCTCEFTNHKTGEKTILKERKTCEIPNKHEIFNSHLSLKHDNQKTKNLSIVALKLNCDNIEPWCMVHELYRCFCKGKFTETYVSNDPLANEPPSEDTDDDCLENSDVTNDSSNFGECERREDRKEVKQSDNPQTKLNKIQISTSMDKSTYNNKITENLHYSDPQEEIKINRNLAKEADTKLKDSSEIINMSDEKGTLASDKVRKLNMEQYSNNDHHENKSDSEGNIVFKFRDRRNMSSTRTNVYLGRKYSKAFYKNRNNKISKKERKNKKLHGRLAFHYSHVIEEDIFIEPPTETKDVIEEDIIIEPTTETENVIEEDIIILPQFLCDTTKNDEDIIIEPITVTEDVIEEDIIVLPTTETEDVIEEHITILPQLHCDPTKNDENIVFEPTTKTEDVIEEDIIFPQLHCDTTKNDEDILIEPTTETEDVIEENIMIEPTTDTKDIPLPQLHCDTTKNDEDPAPNSKRRYVSNDTNLTTWLESKYNLYRQKNESNLFKHALEYPQEGEIAFHSWDYILYRYRERKNYFFVSQQPPFRIYMTVNSKNPFFNDCIDLNEIRFVDLNKFPTTVKNLLINATDLKDNFCILRGMTICWELIGTVTKVSKRNEHGEQEDTPEIIMESSTSSDMDTLTVFSQKNSVKQKDFPSSPAKELESSTGCSDNAGCSDNIGCSNNTGCSDNTGCSHNTGSSDNIGCSNNNGLSKWFIMAIENDFIEMRFPREGLFVKYQSITDAHNTARDSGKTVRMSSRNCIEHPESPAFGLYVTACDSEYCVFVGPYEMQDTLGIETTKTNVDVRRLKRTRGYWITTNKLDNQKVVDNPSSFALSNSEINIIPIESNFHRNDEVNKHQQEKPAMQDSPNINRTVESKESSPAKKSPIKIVKPITIRKTNGFYHLASDGVFKKIQYPQNTTKAMPVVLKPPLDKVVNIVKPFKKPREIYNVLNINQVPDRIKESFVVPSTSAATQIKIPAVFSKQNNPHIAKSTNHEGRLVILKPEEICRKLVHNKLTATTLTSKYHCYIKDRTKNLSLLQSGLQNVTINEQRSVSNAEWCSITKDATLKCNFWKDIWIECKNIPSLGWITGIKNKDNLLSFKIPGRDYSGFYPEKEAFTKINSELRKRINTLNNFECVWTVHDSIDQLQGKEMNLDHLDP